jgi:hypothetical protein
MKGSTVTFMVCTIFFNLLSLVSAHAVGLNIREAADSMVPPKILRRGTHSLMTTRGVAVSVTIQTVDEDKNCAVRTFSFANNNAVVFIPSFHSIYDL